MYYKKWDIVQVYPTGDVYGPTMVKHFAQNPIVKIIGISVGDSAYIIEDFRGDSRYVRDKHIVGYANQPIALFV